MPVGEGGLGGCGVNSGETPQGAVLQLPGVMHPPKTDCPKPKANRVGGVDELAILCQRAEEWSQPAGALR